ncbi:protein-export chaperone SecB [Marivivens donghaensis]|uniref:Protein-export protein SecB n=1 Tax=Marivivens donghaensis TaxID=1699413 RepID=A0ABX0VTS8_9RHOB|nr:protein-export chaperone SecB [Marivivens donghaensis]NIY71437.1 protein-export chaperone SecB [Marivivens donghaensis]
MSDNPQQPQQPQIKNRIVAQYIRDMSFENILAQKGLKGDPQPEMSVKVALDARKRGENQYEVSTKLTVNSSTKENKEPLFILEVDYAGVFHIEGVPEDQLHPYLMIECPRLTFPFLRRVVSDVTRDGGFPPVNLDLIDFVTIYRQELARRVEAQKAEGAEAPVAN